MPITPLDAITYANQNMQVAASKQTDYRGRIDFQNIIAAARINEKPNAVEDVEDLIESVEVDPDKEHHRETAEEQTGEKAEETLRKYKNMQKKVSEDELFESLPYHILDIRV